MILVLVTFWSNESSSNSKLFARLVKAVAAHKHKSGLEVIKLELILRLKIMYNDWLLADTYPQAANHCALF